MGPAQFKNISEVGLLAGNMEFICNSTGICLNINQNAKPIIGPFLQNACFSKFTQQITSSLRCHGVSIFASDLAFGNDQHTQDIFQSHRIFVEILQNIFHPEFEISQFWGCIKSEISNSGRNI